MTVPHLYKRLRVIIYFCIYFKYNSLLSTSTLEKYILVSLSRFTSTVTQLGVNGSPCYSRGGGEGARTLPPGEGGCGVAPDGGAGQTLDLVGSHLAPLRVAGDGRHVRWI